MNAQLTLQVEGRPDKVVPLGAIFSIGRGPSNDLVINDTRASRNHAVIRLQGDRAYSLLDLGSSNGTLLNGKRVTIPCSLKTGDEIRIANACLVFTGGSQESASSEDAPETEMRTEMAFTSETVSILVVDIRNYTVLSEGIPGDFLSRLVGRWFQEVSGIIEKNNGSIDKFIGDAVMALWLKTRTEGNKQHITGPIRAAVEMVGLAQSFHKELTSAYPTFSFHVGCGVNCGQAILGNVGVDARRDFTTVGDCVNVAFRLETLCKELGRPIVVSEEIRRAAGDAFPFEDLGPQKVKGKSKDLQVFGVKL